MKSLKVSWLGLVAIVLFACNKEKGELIVSDSEISGARSQVLANGTPKPVLTPSQSPAPATTGNPVTVSYTATDPGTSAAVNCGRVIIYQWNGSAWVEVASGFSPTASFTFTPLTANDCAYKFRAGFTPGGGSGGVNCSGSYAGVDYTTQQDFCVDVIDACVSIFTIEGNVTGTDIGNGLYEFTVTYTLTSPIDQTGVKFQGGATAGGNSGHAITDLGNTVVVNANNNNTVLKWEGNLVACQPQTVSFKYTRNFSCPATDAAVTGQWSAKSGETVLGLIAPLTYSCN